MESTGAAGSGRASGAGAGGMSALRRLQRNITRTFDHRLTAVEEGILRLGLAADNAGARIPPRTAVEVAYLSAIPKIGRAAARQRANEILAEITQREAAEVPQ